MPTIAFDIMGNDNGIKFEIEAVTKFIYKNPSFKFILCGDKKQIKLPKDKFFKNKIEIIDSSMINQNDEKILKLKNQKNSMVVALNLIKEKKADAIISPGNSKIYLIMATLILKRIPNIKRPAFMVFCPTVIENKKVLFLDVGANLLTTKEMLVQWSYLGSIFSNYVLGIENPKVGLINVGTEKNKGFPFQIEAFNEIQKKSQINFVGFIETRNILKAEVDVAISDGYGGNLVLKTIEGTALALLELLKNNINQKLKYKFGAFLAKKAFQNVKKISDYRNVGAGWILGVNGLVLKAHGNSDVKSYIGAFNQIKQALEKNYLIKFKKVLNE